jgi:hypothetical protein
MLGIRATPLAFIAYALVLTWYVPHGHGSRAANLPTMPWYTQQSGVTFSEMLATLRRASWRERLLDLAATTADLRKSLRPLVDYVAAAADGVGATPAIRPADFRPTRD